MGFCQNEPVRVKVTRFVPAQFHSTPTNNHASLDISLPSSTTILQHLPPLFSSRPSLPRDIQSCGRGCTMPSVRVRRERSSQYTSLQDVYSAEDVARRPRSQSVTQPSTSNVGPSGSPVIGLSATGRHPRNRSYTVDAGGTVASRQSQRLPRPESKIYNHIMSTPPTPRLDNALTLQAARARKESNATGSARDHHSHSDIISLQGSAENIVYRGDGHHAGRIGSALGGGSDLDSEERHHHDDIVEHLDVIGMSFCIVPCTSLTCACNQTPR